MCIRDRKSPVLAVGDVGSDEVAVLEERREPGVERLCLDHAEREDHDVDGDQRIGADRGIARGRRRRDLCGFDARRRAPRPVVAATFDAVLPDGGRGEALRTRRTPAPAAREQGRAIGVPVADLRRARRLLRCVQLISIFSMTTGSSGRSARSVEVVAIASTTCCDAGSVTSPKMVWRRLRCGVCLLYTSDAADE